MDKKVNELKPTVDRKIVKGDGYSLDGDDSWLHPEIDEEEKFDWKARKIIQLIIEKKDFPFVNNFYSESIEMRINLAKYFRALFWVNPNIMFIGEAPGIHGCALTGIPFTSERLIKQGRLDHHFLGTRFFSKGDSYEASAGYFWEMIDQMPRPPVLWNVFPLHPFKIEKGIMKNRTPKKAEKEWGRIILQFVIELFPDIKIISVGNHAKETCVKLGIETTGHIIHPAYHANEFREQFRSHLLS
jgi:uracil-DNA glycosylase